MEFASSGVQVAGATTGRYLVLFEEGAHAAGIAALSSAAGVKTVTRTEKVTEPKPDGALLFESLGVAVVDASPEQIRAIGPATADAPGILAVEPERVVYALEAPAVRSADYLQGFRDATLALTAPAASGAAAGAIAEALDEAQATWGLQATRVVNSRLSGKGIRVAVLDTGFDLKHPDFGGRSVQTRSFVAGEPVQDGHGHGTHCIGTSMGPKAPVTGPRYGIAYEAEIYAGKVLSNAGSGADAGILGGIDWAVQSGCAVISMSLGANVRLGQAYSRVFEAAAARALKAGSLIVAAAGNSSHRPGDVRPVGHPANCPSIMAVAALDANLAIGFFSDAGLNPDGGQVDVAGPGLDVLSSFKMPTRYMRLSGTSMATPHVAGVAALLAEANPGSRGAALGQLVTARARRLTLSSSDVGAGIVQAP